METIQHTTNLPYIPHYDMWNYAMEHPILFFIMVCFVLLIVGGVFENILKIIMTKTSKPINTVNNNKE